MGEQFEYYNLACKFFKVFFIGRHYSRIISLDLFDGAFLIKEVFNQGRFWKSNLRKKKKANWNNSKIYFRTLLKWLKPQNKWKIHPGKKFIFLEYFQKYWYQGFTGNLEQCFVLFRSSLTGLLVMILLYEKRFSVMWNHWKEIMVGLTRGYHPMKRPILVLTIEQTR